MGPGRSSGTKELWYICEETNLPRRSLVQRVAYRIGNLSNADISDFFVYRRVYRIEPPISSISICPRYAFILSFSAENSPKNPKILWKFRKFSGNSENSPKIQKILQKFRKFSENSENSPKFLKIRRKFLKKKVFSEALISYWYCIISRKNPNIVRYRIESKKAYCSWVYTVQLYTTQAFKLENTP